MTQTAIKSTAQKPSLLAKIAERYSVDPDKMLATLKATAFKGDVTNEQMMALLVVADQYDLNPWLRQIYAFPDPNHGIVPVVGVDGWARIINQHPQFDGVEFKEAGIEGGISKWTECTIYRKDRAHPTVVREYFDEVVRITSAWKSHPRRMLRHKALIQCARLAFGYTGIYDEDEAAHIIEGQVVEETKPVGKPQVMMPKSKSEPAPAEKPPIDDEFLAEMAETQAKIDATTNSADNPV
ncbi:MAG: phage recombination protein Bet [Gammaproteobacteria bacterium]